MCITPHLHKVSQGIDEDSSAQRYLKGNSASVEATANCCLFNSVVGSSHVPNGNPLQYSCLENPVDRGAWWAAVCGVVQSRTRLKRLSMHACVHVPWLLVSFGI